MSFRMLRGRDGREVGRLPRRRSEEGTPVTSTELLAITQLKVPGKFPRDERLRLCHIALHHLCRRYTGRPVGAIAPTVSNSSTAFFDGIGDLIRTRPTLTNVANVRAILIMRAAKIAD
jgi:hypothetical protein